MGEIKNIAPVAVDSFLGLKSCDVVELLLCIKVKVKAKGSVIKKQRLYSSVPGLKTRHLQQILPEYGSPCAA